MRNYKELALFGLMPVAFIATVSMASSHTKSPEEAQLSDYGDPAVISLGAPSGLVEDSPDGQTLTLLDPSKMVLVAARQHVQHERIFEAFPVEEFSTAWNSCNEMKTRLNLHHNDGTNSVASFNAGPDDQHHNKHLHTAPLVTISEQPQRISGESEGIFRAMLVNARHDGDRLVFDIEGHHVAPGEYENLDVMTECVTCLDCRPPCEPEQICY